MNKLLRIIFSALGGGLIGIFAGQLNTVYGCILFTFGVALLVGSIAWTNKQDNYDK